MQRLVCLFLLVCVVGCGDNASSSIPQPSNSITPAQKAPRVVKMVQAQQVITDENGIQRTITVSVPVFESPEPIKALPVEKAPRPKEKRE